MDTRLKEEDRELLEKIAALTEDELKALDDKTKEEYLNFVTMQCDIVLEDDEDDADNNIVFEEINTTSKLILDVWDSMDEINSLEKDGEAAKKKVKKNRFKIIIPIIAIVLPIIVGVFKFFTQKRIKK